MLSIQRGTDPGVMIYMLPLGSGSSKARSYHGWGTPFETFWCCYGTGFDFIIYLKMICFVLIILSWKVSVTCCSHFFYFDSGIESFSKLGDSIYFEEGAQTPTLYVIQYISSSLNWKSGNVLLNQVVDPVHSDDPNLRMTMTFSPKVVHIFLIVFLNKYM